MRAMLIGENVAEVESVRVILNTQGIEMIPAQSLDEALAFLSLKSIDLIISDVSFSGKTGIDLYSALKANSTLAKIKLIFTGESGNPATSEVLNKTGHEFFLPKPLSKETLMPLIRQLLPNQKNFLKARKQLLADTELDAEGSIQLLDEFRISLQGLLEAVEQRSSKAAIRAGFTDSQSFAQMMGTDDLSALFQQYLSSANIDLIQLKQDFEEIDKQIEEMKKILSGESKEEEIKIVDESEKARQAVMEEFSARLAKILQEAQSGDVDRQYELAMLYLMGTPELRNAEEGKKWLHEASKNQHSQALCQFALVSVATCPNLDVPIMQEALSQIDLAQTRGQNEEAAFWKKNVSQEMETLATLIEYGQKNVVCVHAQSSSTICPSNALHGAFCLLHAAKGEPKCQHWVGQLYEKGEAFPQVLMAAAYWLEMAAEKGHLESLHRLGMLYQQHLTGYTNEDERAFQCFEKAAQQDHALSQFYLGKLYHNGVGTDPDLAQARNWYEKAARQGHAQAQFWLGSIIEETTATPNDLSEALKWYLIGAANGSTLAAKQIPIIEQKMEPREIKMAQINADRYMGVKS